MLYKGINFTDHSDPLTKKTLYAYGYKFKLPTEYEHFLCTVNGGIPNLRAFSFFDIAEECASVRTIDFFCIASSVWSDGQGVEFPKNMIQIACCEHGGAVLLNCYGKDRGKVNFINYSFDSSFSDPENIGKDLISPIANSFDEFLGMLRSVEEIDI